LSITKTDRPHHRYTPEQNERRGSSVMPSSPKNKKQKIDLAEVSTKCWEHYRNYLDSLEEGDGDIDELQELIELAGEHVPPSLDNWTCPKDMLSILVSVAYNILADMAIGEFLGSEQDDKSSAQEIQNLLTKSLNFYPENVSLKCISIFTFSISGRIFS
jgi:hypothetical protein